jgi:sulfite reductase alpha subunit-like flavoprotein
VTTALIEPTDVAWKLSYLPDIYEEELKGFLADGTLSHLQVSFSRHDPANVEYVQHRLLSCSSLAWKLIKEGAFIYICGSKQMRAEVKQSATAIIKKESGMNDAETSHCVLGLWASKHYVEDVWG